MTATRPSELVAGSNQRPNHENVNKSSISKGLIKSKSVAFDLETDELLRLDSPQKSLTRNKSSGALKMTPKHLKRSNSKTGFNDEDLENDYSAALSSGKNSRRKSSVIRAQLLREQLEEDANQGSDAKRHLFESN